MNTQGVSVEFSVRLTTWLNRCYSYLAQGQQHELYWAGICDCIASFDGIYGVWIIKKNQHTPQLEILGNCYTGNAGAMQVIKNAITRLKSNTENTESFVSIPFRCPRAIEYNNKPQPDNALNLCIVTILIDRIPYYLASIVETDLHGVLSKTLPDLFSNVLKFNSKNATGVNADFQLIIENLNDLVVKVDDKGRFLFVSPSYCQLFGMEEHELLGRKFMPLVHQDDRAVTAASVKSLVNYPHKSYHEQRAKTAIGWRWLAWSNKAIINKKGKVTAIFAVGRDVTEQKMAEQDLKESEIKFQKAFRNSPNLMLISRIRDGLVYDINYRFANLLGLSHEKIVGRKSTQLGLLKSIDRSHLTKMLLKDGRIEDLELSYFKIGEKKLEGMFSAEIFELNAEKCMVSSFYDLSELKAAQAELEKYRFHLEGLVKQRTERILEINEELDRFARSVSHDLKAPLRAMQGFAMALLEDYSKDIHEDGILYIKRICNAGSQMETLINDLLEYSRLSSLDVKLAPVDTEETIKKAIKNLNHEIEEKKVNIVLDYPLPSVVAHSPVLVQIFTNLISNAIKFTQKDKKIKIQIFSRESGNNVEICVKDNGIGIDKIYQERIFNVFERLHGIESYPGTGIGLTIVKKGLERIGGQIQIKSKPGQGSTFKVILPAAEKVVNR